MSILNQFHRRRAVNLLPLWLLWVLLLVLPPKGLGQEQRVFTSPDQAAAALFAAARNDDLATLKSILGPNSEPLLSSGDPIADKNALAEFAAEYEQMHRLAYDDKGQVIIYLGADNWPGPIPLVHKDGGWIFDTAAGKDELIYRRIGRNELYTIAVLEDLAAAQHEYASEVHDGTRQFARYILSEPGKQNGLYWTSAAGAPVSPIGPLIAGAAAQGYKLAKPRSLTPFYGYIYKVLTSQGKNAPGGAKDYLVSKRMTGGFAFLAWPADYRSSGVMTFMINQDSVLVQKDLGADSSHIAAAMTDFNPDSTWQQVEGRSAAINVVQ